MSRVLLAVVLSLISTALLAHDTTLEAMDEYTGFAPYEAGIILPAQITDDVFDDFLFIDTRTEEVHAQATIDGAIHSNGARFSLVWMRCQRNAKRFCFATLVSYQPSPRLAFG